DRLVDARTNGRRQVVIVLRRPDNVHRLGSLELVERAFDHRHVRITGVAGDGAHGRRAATGRGRGDQGVDLAGRPDGLGEDAREITAAGDQLANLGAWLDLGDGQHLGRLAVDIAVLVGGR